MTPMERQKKRLETKERKERLENLCRNFIRDNRIRCAETIYQRDDALEDVGSFIEAICEQLGYYQDDDEDADAV